MFQTDTERMLFFIILAMLFVFALDVVHRTVIYLKNRDSREKEREDEKAERVAIDYLAKKERERIASEIRSELEAKAELESVERKTVASEVAAILEKQHQMDTVERDKNSKLVIGKIDEHEEKINTAAGQVQAIAEQTTREIKAAIEANSDKLDSLEK